MRISVFGMLATVLVTVPGWAQDRSTHVLIPDAPASPDVTVDQLDNPARAEAFTSQVSSEPAAPSLIQLSSDEPSASVPPGPSRRSDSAPGHVDPILGSDSCDHAAPPSKAVTVCERVIEQRAAEFGKAARPSAEQTLLSSQLLTPTPLSTADRAATEDNRNLGIAPDSRGDQELASMVLRPPVAESGPRTEMDAPENSNALADILATLKIGIEGGTVSGN